MNEGLLDKFKAKISSARDKSDKLTKELHMLASWYSSIAAAAKKAANFTEKHPYLTTMLTMGGEAALDAHYKLTKKNK